MNSERVVEWQLGSWLGLSTGATLVLLALVAIGAVVLAAFLYRFTFRTIPPHQRVLVTALRCALLLSVLACLAAPARVERIYDSNRDARPLAVLVDRSASMDIADSRGATRLSSAVQVWKKVETDAIHAFPSLRYFRFGDSLEEAADLETAVTSQTSGANTRLYDSLDQVMKDAPTGGYSGIVCLTDGLDTTETTPEKCVIEALQNHSPLYFAVGQSHGPPQETLLVRELDVPGQVLRKSQFPARVLIEAHAARDRDVTVSLSMDDQSIAQTSFHLHAGANLIPWSVPVNSAEPGLLHLDCRLGEGSEQESISAAVRVVAQEQTPVLFYQGSLDWSFRFINAELQSDPGFLMTGLFSPDLSLSREVAPSGPQAALTEMPDAVAGLQQFKVVVLSNIFARQLSAAQQTALTDYVRSGGGLLFLVSDSEMAATFSGTTLEGLLPVIFEAAPHNDNETETVEDFEQKMRETSGPSPDTAGDTADASSKAGFEPLKKFVIPSRPDHSGVADLLGTAAGGLLQNLPQFSTYARVRGIKAGGDVVAVHPDDKGDANTPRALLVTQRFGRGHITAFLTDGLWRWKLSLPSTSHDPQIFWQQLFHMLATQEDARGDLRFSVQPFFASLGQNCHFQLDGAQGKNAPVVTATPPDGTSQAIPVQFSPESNRWLFQLNPNAPGKWRIHAEDGRGAQMETLLRVSGLSHTKELSGAPADIDGMRRLAEATGGSLLNAGTPKNWSVPNTPNPATLVSKRSEPLWNTWPLLLICLGLYVTELICRRLAKLL